MMDAVLDGLKYLALDWNQGVECHYDNSNTI